MQSITLNAHVGPDGNLQLQLPDALKGRDITITIQLAKPDWLTTLEATAGSIPDLERPPQGEDDLRDSL